MKQKLTQLDVAIIIKELCLLEGYRIQNIYSKENKTLFKFYTKADKQFLMAEQGIRIHLTNYQLSGCDAFCTKLRKHLKSRKLKAITQLGFDKVVLLTFANAYLIIELYNAGNMILLDDKWKIIGIQRIVENIFKVGNLYPFHMVNAFERFTREEFEKTLEEKKTMQIKRVKFGSIPAVLIDHFLALKGKSGNIKISKLVEDQAMIDELFETLLNAEKLLFEILSAPPKGFIFSEPSSDVSAESKVTYYDVSPYSFAQFASFKSIEFNTFNLALDEYFTQQATIKTIQKQQLTQAKQQLKLQSASQEHENKLNSYLNEINECYQKAQAIIANEALVDEILKSVLRLVGEGLDWKEIERIVDEEKLRGNELAQAVKSFQLEIDAITIELVVEEDSDDEAGSSSEGSESESESSKSSESNHVLNVQLMLSLTAFGNAQKYFNTRKTLQAKFEKMRQAIAVKTPKVIKNEKVDIAAAVPRVIRKQYWFEKFLWFISSENYLVLGGKDAHQNETLVKRYFKNGDIYVHADVSGSTSVIIKNKSKDDVIPINTIIQAGNMAICHSKAWDNKIMTSSYYVYHHQVSKTAPTGEYLTTGSFMIRGKKNYLPPTQLQYGFGLLFKFSGEDEAGEASVKRHWAERRPGERETSDAVFEGHQAAKSVNEVPDQLKKNSNNSLQLNPSTELDDDIQKLSEKYNLQDLGDEQDEDYLESMGLLKKPTGDRKKYVSKKEKKKDINEEPVKENNSIKKDANDSTNSKQSSLPRGKRSKAKRMKKKYGDIDEEDLQLRMKLLQSSGKSNIDEDKVSLTDEKAEEVEPEKVEESVNLPYSIFDELDKLFPREHKESSESDDAHVPEEENQENDEIEEEQSQENEVEEGDQEPENNETDVLDFFTGNPQPEDVLLHALPVCAPYSALSGYSYKLKLVPGALKKGKAAKQIMNIFQEQAADPVIKGFVKAINENDFVQSVLAKVRIVGSSDDKKKGKKNTKGKSKEKKGKN